MIAPRARTAVAVSCALAVAALAGCEEGIAPAVPTDGPRYGLVGIDATPLPLFAWTAGADSALLTAETVTLRRDGLAAFVRTYRTVAPGAAPREGAMEFGLRYTRNGATIEMQNGTVCVTLPCPNFALGGTVTDSTLELTEHEAPNRVYRYRRIGG